MNKKIEKEKASGITNEFTLKTGQTENLLLATEDEKKEFSSIIHNTNSPQMSSLKSEIIYIKELLRKNNMLVEQSNLGPEFSDDYGRIKRPLLANVFGKSASMVEKGNLILVTSSIPGEGKTYTAINLALSIAHEQDNTVLLIDCDVAHHGASSALDITSKLGLVDILRSDDLLVSDVILRTDIPGLCIMSSGKQHHFVTELLASQRMSELVTEISERYNDRVIIFDGPPLLPTPQTQILSNLVGQVVFVIEAGKTPQSVVEEALDMISKERATGLVMNKCEGISGRSRYYYGYSNEN